MSAPTNDRELSVWEHGRRQGHEEARRHDGLRRVERILLLKSYCDGDDTCTDEVPCIECLQLNIMFIMQRPYRTLSDPWQITDDLGSWTYNRRIQATGLPRDEACRELQRLAMGESLAKRSFVDPSVA